MPEPTAKELREENEKQRAEMKRRIENPTPEEQAETTRAAAELDELFPSSPDPR